MATIPKDAASIRAEIERLKKQGKTESTSKQVGKLVNALKVLEPGKYGAEQVASAKRGLVVSTKPETQQALGIASGKTSTTTSTGATTSVQPSGQPAIDLNKIYETATKSTEITDLQAKIKEKETALATATATINDNPFYSEATRTGRIAKLESRAANEINLLKEELAQKQADAQVKVNIALKQYDIDNQAYQQNLQKLNLLISSGAILSASTSDVSQIALATGLSTSQIKAIQDSTRTKQQNLQVATDNSGNVTIYDVGTGKIVNTIKGIGSARVGEDDDKNQEKAFDSAISDGIKQLQSGENWGTVWERIHARFPDVPGVLIDQGLGTEWREAGAFERLEQKKRGF